MKVLFISHTQRVEDPYQDHSTRYRCYHFGEELVQLGHQVGIVPQETLPLSAADDYDFFVFHRPYFTRRLDKFVRSLRKQGKSCCADFDDLLFCLNSVNESPQVLNGRMTHRSVFRRHRRYQRALHLFNRVTVSTATLAGEVRLHHPQAEVHTVANGLSRDWLQRLQRDIPPVRSNRFRMGYFSGTSSHIGDFAHIADILSKFLSQNPQSELLIVGPLQLPDFLQGHSQVIRRPAVHYDELAPLVRRCNVTLAPLEETRFNRCKSNVKLIESIACGVPIISSHNTDFARIPGEHLVIAADNAGWYAALEKHYQRWRQGSGDTVISCTSIMAAGQVVHLLNGWGIDDELSPVVGSEQGSLTVFGVVSSQGYRWKRRSARKIRKLIQNPKNFFRDAWFIRPFIQ